MKKQSLVIGKWKVDIKGNMDHDGRYSISADRLGEDDWILHLFEKGWIVWNDFIPAYYQACRNAGVESVTMKMYY
jgi:hypothetical protein